ncbi:MAG: 4-alpha-glucanotransferase [Pseudomonadota bacterium]
MTPLEQLALAYGIALTWWDISGHEHRVPVPTLEALLHAMGSDPDDPAPALRALNQGAGVAPVTGAPNFDVSVPFGAPDDAFVVTLEDGTEREGRMVEGAAGICLGQHLPMGLHRLSIQGDFACSVPLIIAPRRCLAPQDFGVDRSFGIAAQLYGLRSKRNSAIGDFADLRTAVTGLAEAGADFIGLNPLHALFPAEPGECSPYSPSSRQFLNPVYLPFEPSETSGDLVDYPQVFADKLRELSWRFANLSPLERQDLEEFRTRGGDSLRHHCVFEVLQTTMLAQDPNAFDFRRWPEALQTPGTPEVDAFAEENDKAIAFHAYMQMLAERELQETQKLARDRGMKLGLYRDLAVGVHPAGSMVWSTPGLTLRGVSIGAPPDPFSPNGQYWTLAPFSPTGLATHNFRPLYDDLAANARHAGALRIDHVIGFERQFWIPEGMEPSQGAYVQFPFDVMTRLASLVSHRFDCLIIGEDLGTVPEGFRERMDDVGMLSCRVLWFEQAGDRTTAPSAFPRNSLASISTHDLPTIHGFFEGRDITWREKLGLFADAEIAGRERDAREVEMQRLLRSLEAEGIDAADIIEALSRYLGRSQAALAILQLEDLADEVEQANLPGTIDQHPNWRRRLHTCVEDLLQEPRVQRILMTVREERRR